MPATVERAPQKVARLSFAKCSLCYWLTSCCSTDPMNHSSTDSADVGRNRVGCSDHKRSAFPCCEAAQFTVLLVLEQCL
jgi:hypothetical protein